MKRARLKTEIELMQKQVASLLLYRSVFAAEAGKYFFVLLASLQTALEKNQDKFASIDCLQAYGNWFEALANSNRSWQDYLIERILRDENSFTDRVQKSSLTELPPFLISAARYDLQTLQKLARLSAQQLGQLVWEIARFPSESFPWQAEIAFEPTPVLSKNKHIFELENWADGWEDLAAYYRQYGTGIFAEYFAVSWQKKQFRGIKSFDPIGLEEIVGYESQKKALVKNTEFLLAGYPALNVLLYGSRGSGKSSLVKGLIREYGNRQLRLVELNKSKLKDLPIILEKLRHLPQKFIIFVDDLSFEDDDDTFKSLKVVLEGSATAKAKNAVVYATSNRRHLIREYFSDRPSQSNDEVHAWDSHQEKLSFSDRFGLTLTFEPANQDTYLSIVRHLAGIARISLEPEALESRAKEWATRHNGRSGRTARQFIDFLTGELESIRQSSDRNICSLD